MANAIYYIYIPESVVVISSHHRDTPKLVWRRRIQNLPFSRHDSGLRTHRQLLRQPWRIGIGIGIHPPIRIRTSIGPIVRSICWSSHSNPTFKPGLDEFLR